MIDESAGMTDPVASRSLRLVLNGRAAADPLVAEAVEAVRSRGHRVDVRPIQTAEDAPRLAREAASSGFDAVVAAGGDGTLNQVINGIYESGRLDTCAAGVLPYGTANDFAVACGIPREDPLAALLLVAEGEAHAIDVGSANGALFVNVASGGFCAEITTDTPSEAKRLLGGFAYALTGLASVVGLCAQTLRVRAPGVTWEGPALALTVANGRQAGGGFRVAPNSVLDDGLLDVMIIPEVSFEDFVAAIKDFMHLEDAVEFEHLVRFTTPHLEVEAPDGLQVNLDGEPLNDTRFKFATTSEKLRFYLPPGAPLSRR